MNKIIYFIISQKGGAGKSLVTNLFAAARENAQLVDGDPRNPDIYRMNNSVWRANLLDFEKLQDFIQHAIDDGVSNTYIVNMSAHALEPFITVKDELIDLQQNNNIRLSALFIIDAVNGVDLLSNAKSQLDGALNFDTVILNGGIGSNRTRSAFSDWDNSAVKNGGEYDTFKFKPFNGKEIFLGDLNKTGARTYLKKYDSRILLRDLQVEEKLNTIPVMDRSNISRLSINMIKLFEGV